jgi:DNA-binding NarL/FixJ family response regulator
VRVVIADDSVLHRAAAAQLLEDAGIAVVAQAGDGEELLRKVRAHRPDVAIIDIRMPPGHTDEGLRAARLIRTELPEVGLLLLSQHAEAGYAARLVADGAEGVGYLLKDRVTDVDHFVDAVRQVAARRAVLDPEVVALLAGRDRGGTRLDRLGERERGVLALMAEGASNRAIARRMFLSERAVERSVTAILDTLRIREGKEAHRRVLAVLTYLGAAKAPASRASVRAPSSRPRSRSAMSP